VQGASTAGAVAANRCRRRCVAAIYRRHHRTAERAPLLSHGNLTSAVSDLLILGQGRAAKRDAVERVICVLPLFLSTR